MATRVALSKQCIDEKKSHGDDEKDEHTYIRTLSTRQNIVDTCSTTGARTRVAAEADGVALLADAEAEGRDVVQEELSRRLVLRPAREQIRVPLGTVQDGQDERHVVLAEGVRALAVSGIDPRVGVPVVQVGRDAVVDVGPVLEGRVVVGELGVRAEGPHQAQDPLVDRRRVGAIIDQQEHQ